jgi:hypothetical protein
MRKAASVGGLKSARKLFEQIMTSVQAKVKFRLPGPFTGARLWAMATVFSVQADSREECERELARLCKVLGLRPALAPSRSIGTERWMARAAVVDSRERPTR